MNALSAYLHERVAKIVEIEPAALGVSVSPRVV
jgi:hypothetical protein